MNETTPSEQPSDLDNALELQPTARFFNKSELLQPERFTILSVTKVKDNFKQKDKYVLHLKNPQKEGLIDLNKVNQNRLVETISNIPRKWIGKDIVVSSKKFEEGDILGYQLVIH